MERTIKVKGIESVDGKTNGRSWHKISIKATDGYFYSSFKPIPEEMLKEGSILKLDVTQSKIKDTFEIQKIIDFTPQAVPKAQTGGGEPKHEPNPITPKPSALDEAEAYARNLLKKQKGEAVKELDPLPAQIEQSASYARELTRRARKIAQDETPDWEGMSEYPYLIATLINVMYGKISGDRIAEQEAEKLKAYGNKKW